MVQLIGEPQLDKRRRHRRGASVEPQLSPGGASDPRYRPDHDQHPRPEDNHLVLPRAIGMREVRDYATPANKGSRTHVMGDGGPAAELHAAVEPNIPVAELGAGGVH